MKKLLLLFLLIPDLVMGGMNQNQIPEPVEGNPFEALGDLLNKDKKEKQPHEKEPNEWTPEIKKAQDRLKKEHEKNRPQAYVKKEIPDMLPSGEKSIRNKNITWHSNSIGWLPDGKFLAADKTKLDQLKDGTFIIPTWVPNSKDTAIAYLRVNCKSETVEQLGMWAKNFFDEKGNFKTQDLIGKSTVGYIALHHVCPYDLQPSEDKAPKLLLMAQENQKYRHYTYDLNSIQKVSENDHIMTIGEVDIVNGEMINYSWHNNYKFKFNCSEKSFSFPGKDNGISPDKKIFVNGEMKTLTIYAYPLERSCEYIRLNSSSIEKVNYSVKDPTATPSQPTPTPETDLKIPLDRAKKECKELGFKEGTLNFKNCVVELI